MSREAMKRIKTWSERCEEHPDHQTGMISQRMIQERMQEEIDELRQALETEQEPVAWIKKDRSAIEVSIMSAEYMTNEGFEPLYTAPPKREWVGLTADEIWKCNKAKSGSAVEFHICYEHQNVEDFAESIEAKLKEKNQ